jgi:hypothetical protein
MYATMHFTLQIENACELFAEILPGNLKGGKMNIEDLKKMSTGQRLQAMEALWDSLLYEHKEIESPEWHAKILEERKSIITSGKARFVSLKELKAGRRQ